MIRFFTEHPTAANLLMITFLIAGTLTMPRILRETQPDFAPREVEVRILYPGATAQEVEEAICRRVEDAIDGVDFVVEVRSDAREGFASVVVEMAADGDIETFLRDIETGVKAITDFPEEVEEPIILELGRTDPVLSVLISGPLSGPDLKTYAEGLKDRLQEAGVPLVKVQGFSERQLRVFLSKTALHRLGLSADQVAQRIAAQSKDLPLGTIETRQREILLRLVDQRRTQESLEHLVLFSSPGGGEVLLGDIGRVEDLFERQEDRIMAHGRRNALFKIEKSRTEDAINVAGTVKSFLEAERLRHPQMKLTVTQDETSILRDRLDMLVSNGIQGILLVFATMWLFFNVRVSFWVAMGLPVSFLGAFILVPYIGLSINMFTMVGLLMVLGLLMDDAIVIAENIMVHRQQGESPVAAAVNGTHEVAAGVFSSFITTVCILGPLAFIEGQIGKVLRVVPMILILVLAVSLVEAFCILPAHINHAIHRFDPEKTNRFRRRFEVWFAVTRDRLLAKTVHILLQWRYLFMGSVIALFIFSLGMVASGQIKFQGFPELEGDVVTARLLMPPGTPLPRTKDTVRRILEALERVNQRFQPSQPGGRDLVQDAYVRYDLNTEALENGSHVATITVDLLTAEKRTGTIDSYLQAWRQEIGALPDVLNLTISEPGFGPGGRPIEVRLRGKDLAELDRAATQLKAWFGQFAGVVNLSDDLRPGKPELRMRMREGVHGLGITAAGVGRQLRAAFQGLVADEIQVGPESYEIEVRLPASHRDSLQDLEDFRLLAPNGEQVPLQTVVDWEMGKGWARIARFNGMRVATLRGDVDTRLVNTYELMLLFRDTYLPRFQADYPDIKLTIAGALQETNTTRLSMLRALIIGLVGIFILLSFQFRSYLEPLVVMLAIPLTLIGVVWGHGLMGVPISMPSLLGFIALGGVVVNDSILLVMFLKNARKKGQPIRQAAAQASQARFRAVLLTSSTTIAGLLPLLFERSLQAQILIPLVISTTFGLLASTVLVLLAIPCMYMILADMGLVEKISTPTTDRAVKANIT